MKAKLSTIFMVAFAMLSGALFMVPATYATDPFCDPKRKDVIGEEAWNALGCNAETDPKSTDLVGDVTTILEVIIGALGIVAVVLVIMGGVTYMTSAGDAGKVKKGKDTILYALIGLVICALAFAIVNFVASSL